MIISENIASQSQENKEKIRKKREMVIIGGHDVEGVILKFCGLMFLNAYNNSIAKIWHVHSQSCKL